jgi:hypothetical protein
MGSSIMPVLVYTGNFLFYDIIPFTKPLLMLPKDGKRRSLLPYV